MSLKSLVDEAFAAIIAGANGHPLVQMVLKFVQGQLDTWMTANGWGNATVQK